MVKLFSVTKKDFSWDTFRCGGPGGQNVNKRNTGVRCTHAPSGAVGKSCETRHQDKNRLEAWKKCVNSVDFRMWINRQVFDLTQREAIEKEIDRQLALAKVEVFKDGEWTTW